jgi:VIT1/CCC1 family predicted Fe2+/Mn2+ transporter
VQKQVGNLKELHEEKFAGVDKRFEERDLRTDKIAELNQKALDAALLTAEKAVSKQNESFLAASAKSEAATTKQFDAMQALIVANAKAEDGKISDLKDRVTTIESFGMGRSAAGTTRNSVSTLVISGVAALVGVAGLMVAVVALLSK